MHRFAVTGLLALLCSQAWAVPMQFSQQGRVHDALGQPLTGSNTLDFALYDTPSGGTAMWSEGHTITLDDGYYALTLGETNAIDSTWFDGDTVYLAITVNGGAEIADRLRLLTVPYAIRAASADSLAGGGALDVTEVAVNGTTVIDSSGNIDWASIVNAPELASLVCTDGTVPLFDTGAWTCADSNAHSHDASAISSGTLAAERLNFGTGPDTVAEGDHGHADYLALTGGTLSGTLNGADASFSGDVSGAAGSFSGDVSGAAGSFSGDVSGAAGTFSGDVSGAAGSFSGDLGAGDGRFTGLVQVGATSVTCDSTVAGSLRFDSTNQTLELCADGAWLEVGGGSNGQAPSSAAISCYDLHQQYPAATDGVYWIRPDSAAAFQVYCDMTNDGGGWALVARMTVAGGQAHWNTGAVNLVSEVTPNLSGAEKFADDRINAIQAASSYAGPTSYRMTCWEGQSFAQTMFCSSQCTFNAQASVNSSECSRCTGTFEGSLVQLTPNTGTRGLGHHHDYSYAWSMAYQRHPEQGSNPGCRNDNRGSGDGHLWVK